MHNTNRFAAALAVATAESLLADADLALYRAKREGRDRIVTAPLDVGRSKS